MSPLIYIIYLAICVLELASLWKLFAKADQPGWAAIIPIYNVYVMLKIGDKPAWWLIMICFVPVANIIFSIMSLAAFLKAYGKEGVGPVLLAIFFGLIYIPILAFSSDVQYVQNAQANM